jgi:exonuclease III
VLGSCSSQGKVFLAAASQIGSVETGIPILYRTEPSAKIGKFCINTVNLSAVVLFVSLCSSALPRGNCAKRTQTSMHRFFSPAGGADAKRPKVGEDESEGSCESGPLPRSFLSLNVNGLKTRVDQPDGKWLEGIAKLVQELDPDVIAMQEIKLTAKAPPGAKKGDGKPRQRNQPWDNDKQTDWLNVKRKMLEREPWCRYIRRFSCADWRYAGTLTLFRRGLRKPEKVFYNLELEEGRHDDNGRACIAQYSTGLRVANFYVPNNGWTEESNFASRRAWDAKVLDFVRRTHQEQRQLVVVGDLNVAHQDADVTHPEWFLAQTGERSSRGRVAVEGERILEDDKGQPGFTRNEQLRFSQVLRAVRCVCCLRTSVGVHVLAKRACLCVLIARVHRRALASDPCA